MRRLTGSYSCTISLPAYFLGTRWSVTMQTMYLHPSSSWKSDGSKPKPESSVGSDHGPMISGAVTM